MSETAKPSTTITVLTNMLIVGAMVMCVAVAVVQFGQQLVPGWNAGYIPTLVFFIALEVAVTTRYLRVAQARLPAPWYVLRAVELVLVFLAIRSVLGLIRGPDFVLKYDSFYGGSDIELFALCLVVGVCWLIGWYFTRCLLDLESGDSALDRELMLDLDRSQQAARQALITLILLSGVTLVLLSAVERMSLRNADQSIVAAQLSVVHVLIFFVLGLILLSKTRLAVLRSAWQWERVPMGRGLTTRWISYSLMLIAGLLIIAIVLPTQYSLGLLSTLNYLVSLIAAVIQFVFLLIAAVLSTLLGWLFPQVPRPLRPLPELPTPPDMPATQIAPTLSDFAQSLIFWAVFVMVIIYLGLQYARQHPAFENVLRRLPGWSIFGRWWRWLRAFFGGLGAKITATLEARRQLRSAMAGRSGAQANRWVNARHLSPRDQIRFYYQALLQRGHERGYPRGAAQTPHEYAHDLTSTVPELERDVSALTEQFVEARYSQHTITAERVNVVRRAWEHIRRALRRRSLV